MDTAAVLNLVSSSALLAGLVFAGLQVRIAQQQRRREAAVQLVQSFRTPEFVSGIAAMLELPDGLTKAELQSNYGGQLDNILLMMLAIESVGILVQKREIPIQLAEDFYFTPTVVGWRKMRRYVEDMRAEQGVDSPLEFFQFLAEQMMRRQSAAPALPAYVAYRNWHP